MARYNVVGYLRQSANVDPWSVCRLMPPPPASNPAPKGYFRGLGQLRVRRNSQSASAPRQQCSYKLDGLHVQQIASSTGSATLSCESECHLYANTTLSQPKVIPQSSARIDHHHANPTDDDGHGMALESRIIIPAVRTAFSLQILHSSRRFKQSANKTASYNTACRSGGPIASSSAQQAGSRTRAKISNENEKGKERGKRKRNNKDESEAERDQQSPKKHCPPIDSSDDTGCLLACPFYKWKPLSYPACRALNLSTFARVKQHLRRRHLIPLHCTICFVEFEEQDDLDIHTESQTCETTEPKHWEGVTEEQLKKRANRSKEPKQQWLDFYTLLFPSGPQQESAYVERTSSLDIAELRTFISQNWPSSLDDFFNKELPECLQGHKAHVREFAKILFEHTFSSLLDEYDSSHTRVSAPPSRSTDDAGNSMAVDLATSVAITNTEQIEQEHDLRGVGGGFVISSGSASEPGIQGSRQYVRGGEYCNNAQKDALLGYSFDQIKFNEISEDLTDAMENWDLWLDSQGFGEDPSDWMETQGGTGLDHQGFGKDSEHSFE